MTVKIYCDICGEEIPEAAEGEGEDAGSLKMGWGPWGEKSTEEIFDFDALCRECTSAVKDSITRCIKERKKK